MNIQPEQAEKKINTDKEEKTTEKTITFGISNTNCFSDYEDYAIEHNLPCEPNDLDSDY